MESAKPIGQNAKQQGRSGVACRSAARPDGEELAWFTERGGQATQTQAFADWYWGDGSGGGLASMLGRSWQ